MALRSSEASPGIGVDDIFRRIEEHETSEFPDSGPGPGPMSAGYRGGGSADIRSSGIGTGSREPFTGYDTPGSDGRSLGHRSEHEREDRHSGARGGYYAGPSHSSRQYRRDRSRSSSSRSSHRTEAENDLETRKLEVYLMVQTLEKKLEGFGVKLPRPVHPHMSMQELDSMYQVLKRQRLKIRGGKQLRQYIIGGANLVELATRHFPGIGLDLEDFSEEIEHALDEDDTLVDDLAEEDSSLLNIPSSVRLALLIGTAGISTHASNKAKKEAQARRAAAMSSASVPASVPPVIPRTVPANADDTISLSDASGGTETSSVRGKRRGRKPQLAAEGTIEL